MCPVRMCADVGFVNCQDGGHGVVGGGGVEKAEGDVGSPDCGMIRDQADGFEVDILRRCGPLGERCQGA